MDERQELELLKIEHVGFWIMFWALTISIIIQTIFMNKDFDEIIGEMIVLLIGAGCIIIGCAKKGQWDYYSQPSMKNYLLYSTITATIFSLLIGVKKWKQYEVFREDFWGMAIPIVLILFVSCFALVFISLFICGKIVQNRRKKLEKEYEEID